MNKMKRKKTLFGAIAVGLLAFTIYGFLSWFFPNDFFVSVATLPAIALGLLLAYPLCRRGALDPERLRSQKIGRPIYCLGTATFVLVFSWIAVVVGVPALITLTLTPNAEEVAVTSTKIEGGLRRACDYKLGLVGYEVMFKETFCVNEKIWNEVSTDEKVIVLVRKDIFGTRIFDIRPRSSD